VTIGSDQTGSQERAKSDAGAGDAGASLFDDTPTTSKADFKILFPLLLLIVLAVVGVWSINRFVGEERDRELTAWQVRMGIIVDSRAAEINRWVDRQTKDLAGLADNESVQLYVSSIAEFNAAQAGGKADANQQDEISGFREYLRNLLTVTAGRAGFSGKAAQDVKVNEQQTATAGLLIVDQQGNVMATSTAAPPFDGQVRDFVQHLQAGAAGVSSIFLNARGNPVMVFAVPLYAVQSDQTPASQIGRIVGVKEIASELYPLLRQPGETSQTATAVLLLNHDNVVTYLSPVADDKQPTSALGRDMDLSTPQLDAAFAVMRVNGFATDRKDYRGNDVLVISRSLQQVPWVLMYTVGYQEALGAADQRFQQLTTYLGLALLVLAIAIIAVWRHGSSRRASHAAQQFKRMARRFDEQRELLQMVTDSQPTSIFILDETNRYRFANAQTAQQTGLKPQELLGKEINAVLGPAAAKRYIALGKQVRELGANVTDVARLEQGNHLKVVQTEQIPLKGHVGHADDVLTVERDITDVVTERERRARTLQQLVKTLVEVVDKRDPFAANHSMRVAAVARAIAQEMGLTETEIETAEIAGNLLNLGKILIPTDLLAKSGNLTSEELNLVRNSIQASADLLQDIEFDGPVVDTLRQAQARWDGSGTPPIAGDQILVTARIIGVANALVGMTSDRAFRSAIGIDEAVESLLKESGKGFDRRVVAALVNYVDNHGGRDALLAAVGGPVQPAAN
jgi:HD-GYP domain-containing protein (c-di-GMP phosphodiesterase class II)